jgi:hypothetical protein
MTVADWALVISIFSAVISLAALAWNVWSTFIYPKAKVRVAFSMSVLIQPGKDRSQDYELLNLSATNMGPGEVTLTSAMIRLKNAAPRSKATPRLTGARSIQPSGLL